MNLYLVTVVLALAVLFSVIIFFTKDENVFVNKKTKEYSKGFGIGEVDAGDDVSPNINMNLGASGSLTTKTLTTTGDVDVTGTVNASGDVNVTGTVTTGTVTTGVLQFSGEVVDDDAVHFIKFDTGKTNMGGTNITCPKGSFLNALTATRDGSYIIITGTCQQIYNK